MLLKYHTPKQYLLGKTDNEHIDTQPDALAEKAIEAFQGWDWLID
jgi:hypothetical protein